MSWDAASRCAVDFVHGIHEPLERSAAVLDGILTGEREEENDDDSMSGRNDGDDGFDQRWYGADNSSDYEARRDIWLNGLDVNVQRHNFGYVDDDGDDGECGIWVSGNANAIVRTYRNYQMPLSLRNWMENI